MAFSFIVLVHRPVQFSYVYLGYFGHLFMLAMKALEDKKSSNTKAFSQLICLGAMTRSHFWSLCDIPFLASIFIIFISLSIPEGSISSVCLVNL